MNREVREIRKSIAQRKKEKEVAGNRTRPSTSPISYVQEEEKFGYLPFSSPSEGKPGANTELVTAFVFKSIVAAVLFFSVAILFRMDATFLQKPKDFITHAVTEEFQFAAVNQWYKQKFGEPLAFLPQTPGSTDAVPVTSQFALPVTGKIHESFQKNGQGILIETIQETNVHASDQGSVMFAGNKKETGKTVVIQHADGSKSYYGFLKTINVNAYEHVEHGKVIGTTAPVTNGNDQHFYFAIEKGNQFVDPIQVIQVNDQQ